MSITINGSGTITGINAGGLPDGSVTAADIESSLDLTGKTVTLPSGTGGKILQVMQGAETKVLSFTVSAQNQWNSILSTSIIPVAADSNILVMWYTSLATATANQRGTARILRDSTAIGVGDVGGTRLQGSHGSSIVTIGTDIIPLNQNFLDDPTYTLGDSITYQLQASFEQSAGTLYVNRSATDSNANTYHRGSTFMQLIEVAA